MDQHSDDTSREVDEVDEVDGVASGGSAVEPRPPLDYEPTGVESVDRVLADVATVADRPVAEHVAVFERAHEQLRRALDARPDADAQPDPPTGGGQVA